MTEAPIRNPAVVRALLQAHLSSELVREQMFRFHRIQQHVMGGLFRLGQQRGEIRKDIAPEELAQIQRQMIFGTLLFWSLIGDASLTARIEQAVNIVWEGISTHSSAKSSAKMGRRHGVRV
jgi:hypothetical protein